MLRGRRQWGGGVLHFSIYYSSRHQKSPIARGPEEEFSFFLVCLSNYVWLFRSACCCCCCWSWPQCHIQQHPYQEDSREARERARVPCGVPYLVVRFLAQHISHILLLLFLPLIRHLLLPLKVPSCNLPFYGLSLPTTRYICIYISLFVYFSICFNYFVCTRGPFGPSPRAQHLLQPTSSLLHLSTLLWWFITVAGAVWLAGRRPRRRLHFRHTVFLEALVKFNDLFWCVDKALNNRR